MFGRKKGFSAARIDTLVGQGTEINGDLVFSGGLHVDGTINGNVVAEEGSTALLILSEFGRIEGEVKVPLPSTISDVRTLAPTPVSLRQLIPIVCSPGSIGTVSSPASARSGSTTPSIITLVTSAVSGKRIVCCAPRVLR